MRVTVLTTIHPNSPNFETFLPRLPSLRAICDLALVHMAEFHLHDETGTVSQNHWNETADEWQKKDVGSAFDLSPFDREFSDDVKAMNDAFSHDGPGDIRRADRIVLLVLGYREMEEWYVGERIRATNPRAEVVVYRKTDLFSLVGHLKWVVTDRHLSDDLFAPFVPPVKSGTGSDLLDALYGLDEHEIRPDLERLPEASPEILRKILKLYVKYRLTKGAVVRQYVDFDPEISYGFQYNDLTVGIALTLAASRRNSTEPYRIAEHILTHDEWRSFGDRLLCTDWRQPSHPRRFNQTALLAMDRLEEAGLRLPDLGERLGTWYAEGLAKVRSDIDAYLAEFVRRWNAMPIPSTEKGGQPESDPCAS